MVNFNDLYNGVKEKVINLIKDSEISEGHINFEYLVGETIKELMLANGDIKRKQIIPRDIQNYPIKNIIYRTDSKRKATKKDLRIK